MQGRVVFVQPIETRDVFASRRRGEVALTVDSAMQFARTRTVWAREEKVGQLAAWIGAGRDRQSRPDGFTIVGVFDVKRKSA